MRPPYITTATAEELGTKDESDIESASSQVPANLQADPKMSEVFFNSSKPPRRRLGRRVTRFVLELLDAPTGRGQRTSGG